MKGSIIIIRLSHILMRRVVIISMVTSLSPTLLPAFLHMGSNGQHLINRAVFFPVLLTNTLKWHTFNMLILSYKCFHFVLYV